MSDRKFEANAIGPPAPAEAQRASGRAKTLLGRAKTVARLLEPASVPSVAHDDSSSFARTDARLLAEHVRERVRDRAEKKDVDIVLHCKCGGVWVEPDAFSEALYQLIDNAVRATRRSHPVVVDVRDTAEGDVLWQIQDAGEGMAERVLAELGHARPTVPTEGSGHGVAVAWAIIDRHGGLLRFESAPGVGTTASIWLPHRG